MGRYSYHIPSPLMFVVIMLTDGCLPFPHHYYARNADPRTFKEQVKMELVHLATRAELASLDSLSDNGAIDIFLDNFWSRRNPAPGSAFNTARDEFEERVRFANEHFGGMQLDRGRVYVVYGPPDERHFENLPNFKLGIQHIGSMEVWVYYRLPGQRGLRTMFDGYEPGLMMFVFADLLGFGHMEQIYSTEIGEKADARVYRR